MNHQDHVDLLREGVQSDRILDASIDHDQPPIWADFGSGTGAFTLALADLLPSQGLIYSVDRNHRALEQQERAFHDRFPNREVIYLPADFTRPLEIPQLDGVVMANALHFQSHKIPLLQLIKNYLHPAGRFILVEYNIDRGNLWVPYPLSYPTWEKLAQQNGFWHTHRLAVKPSHFLKEIYSALSYVSKMSQES